jgi:murein tripeptide amidase MpaA
VPELSFDHFYSYDELTSTLQAWAEERPELVQVESMGKSYEGRDIWLVTLTNAATGPSIEKPGFLVEANIHAVEWTGSAAALHLIRRLVDGHGSDERVTRLLDTRTMYVVPRLNPDGAEHALLQGRFIRSSVRPYPLQEQPDGLRIADVDGDGRVLSMRLKDPNGPWKPHAEDPRVMVRREPDDYDGDFYRLFPEGEIENYDGVLVKVAPPLEGLDLNRNFPADWGTESEQRGAGPFPGSEPETRAYLAAVVDRPNITGYIAYHTFSGVHLRPYAAHPDDDIPTFDLRTFKLLGEKGTELTGYPHVSVFHDFKYDPKQVLRGGAHDWFYDHLGVFAWTTEFWSPQREAGIEPGYHLTDWIRDHPVEDDLKLMRWNDEALGGKGFVDWRAFEHPQLGTVEIGGWDILNYWFNTPFDRLEQELEPHTEWAIFHALVSPLLEIRTLETEQLGEDVHRVRLVAQNSGWLPTNVSEKAQERQAVRPVEVELELPDGARLAAGDVKTELGQLAGRVEARSTTWWGNDPSTSDLAKVEWVVEAPAGTVVRVEARHQRAGTVRGEIRLG